jgi:hypothetical protein
MQVEIPVELAKLLLKEDREIINKLTEKCLKEQKPTELRVAESVPV